MPDTAPTVRWSELRSSALNARPFETVFSWTAGSVRFGLGATGDVGPELRSRGASRVVVVSDQNLVQAGVVGMVAASLTGVGIDFEIWAHAQTEPTEQSIQRGADALAGVQMDALVAVGGGSVIDTAKLINLLLTHGGTLRDYTARPHGLARPIPGQLMPLIAVPTTAGTGSEMTSNAIVGVGVHVKAAVASHHLRPVLAVVDPLNCVSAPPSVTASAGYDALVQALESLTSKPLHERPRAAHPSQRPAYAGHNLMSEMWCETAVKYAARYLVRAVDDGSDIEAREGMCFAALCSRLGNAGVHLPHANAYAIASQATDYQPPGFLVDRPLVPHGQSVIVTAPAAFDALQNAAKTQVERSAELLGVDAETRREAPGTALGIWLRNLLQRTNGPTSLDALGLVPEAVESMVAQVMTHERILVCCPAPVTEELVRRILSASFVDQPTHNPKKDTA